MVQKLNITQAFRKKYSDWVNPDLISLKFCCDDKDCFLELVFKNDPENIIIHNLSFIADDYNDTLVDYDMFDISRLFHPGKDFVDNATNFLNMDPYSIIHCVSNLITEEAANFISDKHMNEIM